MRALIVVLFCLLLIISSPSAIERKPFEEIDSDRLASELQVAAPSGERNMNFIWWVPVEFWEVVMNQDRNAGEAEVEDMLTALRPYAIFAVVNADISSLGAFRFYSYDEVSAGTRFSYIDADGTTHDVVPVAERSDDVEILLGVFKPMLRSAMGQMGENMHFFVVEDRAEDGARLLDPYEEGRLVIDLTTRDGDTLQATITTPVDALFVPRKCPNGKDAHVSWNYCPWTGKKLEE